MNIIVGRGEVNFRGWVSFSGFGFWKIKKVSRLSLLFLFMYRIFLLYFYSLSKIMNTIVGRGGVSFKGRFSPSGFGFWKTKKVSRLSLPLLPIYRIFLKLTVKHMQKPKTIKHIPQFYISTVKLIENTWTLKNIKHLYIQIYLILNI